MPKQIFINLPVHTLEHSINFFSRLGFKFNQAFTDEQSTCMIIEENIFVMLLEEQKFKTYTPKKICNAKKQTEVLLALSVSSREAVNQMVEKAIESGGKEPRKAQDHGFMYGRSFEDLDGHIWEVFYMDSNKNIQDN